MARLILVLAEIASYSLLLRTLGIPLSLGPSLYAGAVIVGLYCADFVGLLQPASMAVHVGGIAACIATAIYHVKSFTWRSVRFGLFPIAVCVLTLGLVAILGNFAFNENAKFARTDEFSHWGTIIRAIYEADTFHFNPNPLYFQDYPPGAALFSYHVLQLLGYTEGHAMFSYSLLILCLASGVVGLSARLGIIVFLTVSWLLYLSVGLFGAGWSNVLIDHILSATFASAVIAYLSLRKDSRAILVVPLLLAATVLIKQAGFMLALLAAGICVVDLVILRFTDRVQPNARAVFVLSRSDVAWAIAMFVVPVAAYLSWTTYVSWAGLTTGWGTYSPQGYLQNVFNCCQTSREIEVASKFFAQGLNVAPSAQTAESLWAFFTDAAGKFHWESVIDPQTREAPFVAAVILLLIGLVFAAIVPRARNKVRALALTGILAVGFLGYAASVLLAYLYRFSDFEGRVLISFHRYLHVFILAWILINLTMAMLVLRRSMIVVRIVVVLIAAGTAGTSLWYWPHTPTMEAAQEYWPPARAIELVQAQTAPAERYRAEVASFTDQFRSMLPKEAKVYLMWQGSNGLEILISRYELLPRLTNMKCWSVGEPMTADDIYPCKRPQDAFAGLLADYEYVAVGKGLASIVREYPGLFNGADQDWARKDRGLFKIEGSGPGLTLRHLPAGF